MIVCSYAFLSTNPCRDQAILTSVKRVGTTYNCSKSRLSNAKRPDSQTRHACQCRLVALVLCLNNALDGVFNATDSGQMDHTVFYWPRSDPRCTFIRRSLSEAMLSTCRRQRHLLCRTRAGRPLSGRPAPPVVPTACQGPPGVAGGSSGGAA